MPVLDAVRAYLAHQRDPLHAPEAPAQIHVAGQLVWISGLRLQTLATATVCQCSNRACAVMATHVAVERQVDGHGMPLTGHGYHLNVYGLRGEVEVLFTHDHTLARSLGGANDLTNTTPMCLACNATKSRHEHVLLGQRRRAEGLDPQTGMVAEGQVVEYRHRMVQLAAQHGLAVDAYRDWLNAEGAAGQSDLPWVHPDGLGQRLGLTRNGLQVLQQQHNRHQRVQVKPAVVAQQAMVACRIDALSDHLQACAAVQGLTPDAFRAQLEADAVAHGALDPDWTPSNKHREQAKRLALSDAALVEFRAHYPRRPTPGPMPTSAPRHASPRRARP